MPKLTRAELAKAFREMPEDRRITGRLFARRPDNTLCMCAQGLLAKTMIEADPDCGLSYYQVATNDPGVKIHREQYFYGLNAKDIEDMGVIDLNMEELEALVEYNDTLDLSFADMAKLIEASSTERRLNTLPLKEML